MSTTVRADRAASGSTTIAPRALRRLVSALTADALRVEASDVAVDLVDHDGLLSVVARTPIHLRPLGDPARRTDGTLLERLESAQTSIRDRCLQLSGSTVGRVELRVTGVDLRERRRVL